MKITVVGLGYVGLVAAVNLAKAGHQVLGVDADAKRIITLQSGDVPFYEPGLEELLHKAKKPKTSGGLTFCWSESTNDVSDITLICVGTPQTESGAADLRQVRSAVEWVKAGNRDDATVVMKSTVPPGTGQQIIERELKGTDIRYVSNPEFLREGQAVHDWQHPDRIVIGMESNISYHRTPLREMYRGIDAPFMFTDVASAEMTKYASNALLATRISFINEIAALCERTGASIDDVSKGIAMDPRTGSRMYAGVGYGGSCFPKDVRALDYVGLSHGTNTELLRSVVNINNRQKLLPIYTLRQHIDLQEARVAVLGLSFKPGTDDVRDAPALDLIRALVDSGATVGAYDPKVQSLVGAYLAKSMRDATLGAQAVVLMTEWDEIVSADWSRIAGYMGEPRLLFDGRNALDGTRMKALGFKYVGVGRPNP